MESNVLYLFKNTRAVILAQKSIIKLNLKCLIIPVPRTISSECGMCIETKKSNEELIDKTLDELGIYYHKK
ncbi:DUF3343 domain-containing protein [Thiospirochaeta perfilievii]|uniref:DUF3343 domain-containing protein n=1 Tax=Thiospirochaeta perfilievii TaxID=252967 RepID=A0A5C1QAR9_9SPIO|nr:DUF3343 domain-containing protein [Thiospirochaeta perfilievii]QEN04611.1 DUF3343 domain-containing protein [Thiospirochaeta perfilievii]